MIYKLTSIKTVIGKVITDLGLTNDDITVDDYIEWIGEGLKQIGAYYQFTEKQALIPIENYKGELPCDFLYPIEIRDPNGNRVRYNESLIGTTSNEITKNSFTGRDINLNYNYITVGFMTGNLTIQYLAFPVDNEGLPLIPDVAEYRDALFWKVVYQLSIRGFAFRNPQMNDINFTRMMWNKACLKARSEANMPNPDMLERLKNNWLRFKPDLNQYIKRFATNGQQESLNLNGKNLFPNSYNY
jgi:hypothetical protein